MAFDGRQALAQTWLKQTLKEQDFTLVPLTGDASFRRYFRVNQYVLMDAPPEKENSEPFIKVAHLLEQQQVPVPTIHAANLQQGFMLLSDFGDQLLQSALTDDSVDGYYQQAMSILQKIQACTANDLPRYDPTFILFELERFNEWYLGRELNLSLTPSINSILNPVYQQCVSVFAEQPQVFVHRDYHSRNLMILADKQLGVIDFQDAMFGPITYDLISLLKDCYIDWPLHRVDQWVKAYHQQLSLDCSTDQFQEWFDWCGLQRHLKVIGTFARLKHRDQKPNYMLDVPRALQYIFAMCQRYPNLNNFQQFLLDVVSEKVL